MNLILVMIGGFLGAILRFALGEWIYTESFPAGTLIVNLIGCFLLAWFLTFVSRKKRIHSGIPLLIGTGCIGSFTTFSTFSVETIQMFSNGQIFLSALYIMLSSIGGLLFAGFGYMLAIRKQEGEAG